VPNPQFGVTSLLDFSAKPLPAELAATVSALDLDGLLAAARALAEQLDEISKALKPELSAARPDAMARYITADLAVLAQTGLAATGLAAPTAAN
jgi:hypothetical protein